ncbi:MAG: DL-methionine transporter ATP-binding subunit [Legionellales bacterium RIFCSPHIGHO2_12_FULL_35_11]|nr:MAG: DL-methionine transporter ATP-binding subunit [Legionellales bacterium RIFCSPHIGHO2_12_FULL_35_11]
MIEFKGIYKSFASHNALININLFIQEGEIFGIIGKSGAGKSTLLRCINLLEKPDNGEIIIDNANLHKLNTKDLRNARHKIGMIFQQFNLLNSKTVFDNIALPLRIQGISEDIITNKVDELLDLVELTDKKNSYPNKLSGGQKQRVAIARALSCSPKILLCDEATSALDPETTDSILDLLKKINQVFGITIVLITHEMEAVKRICHRLSLMKKGKIIETISLNSVFKKKDSIAREMLYKQLSPQLPYAISHKLIKNITQKPIIKLLFEGEESKLPFISKTSRELHLDINILLANIDSFDNVTCGVLIIEIFADQNILHKFTNRCEEARLTWEILGYINEND